MRGFRSVGFGFASLFTLALLGGCGSSTNSSGGFSSISGDSAGSSSASGSGSGGSDGIVAGVTGGGGSASGSAGSSAGTAGTIGGDAGLCAQQHVNGSSNTNVLLVVDRSTSMTQTPQGFTMDKWAALVQALPAALMPVASSISFGLEFFPTPAGGSRRTGGGGGCNVAMGAQAVQVPIGPGSMTVPTITADLQNQANAPNGSTPTAAALEAALAYFTTGAGANLMGNKYVLLATDGGPNCNAMLTCDAAHCTTNIDGNNNCTPTGQSCCMGMSTSCLDDARTTTAITDLANNGIKTFVVGIPGTEAYAAILDEFAIAGQEVNPNAPPNYYAVSASAGVQGLQDVFSSITQQVIKTCQFQLDQMPQTGYRLAIYVDNNLTTEGTDWMLDTTTNPPTVVLQGDTCNNVLANGAQSVDIEVFCPGVVPPPHIQVN